MSEPMKKPNLTSPESYSPKKPEILNMMKNAAKNEQSQSLPFEFMNAPKDKIAAFSGERWPYSNVTSAFYAVVGLFYGRTENRNNSGELVNDDKEYSIQNVLTGEAFGLFYSPSEHPLSMAAYGFTPCHLEKDDYSTQELITVVKNQIYRGNAVFISKNSIPRAYFIWGYKEDGNVLAGCEFEDGNDGMNCSYDFDNPKVFDSWTNDITGVTFFQPDGEKIEREVVYRKALADGYRMLILI